LEKKKNGRDFQDQPPAIAGTLMADGVQWLSQSENSIFTSRILLKGFMTPIINNKLVKTLTFPWKKFCLLHS